MEFPYILHPVSPDVTSYNQGKLVETKEVTLVHDY